MSLEQKRMGTRSNVLFVLNIFIIFLLLFEHALVIPALLQPFGRMHAMILHFPIVVIILAMILELFQFSIATDLKKFYRDLARSLLFAGVILSGVTVIMGIFLAREQGYNDWILFWHKWAGVAVFFLSSLIYSFQNLSWFHATLAKVTAVATIAVVVFAGHFGAELTHGENFVLQPVSSVAKTKAVPIEQALAFDDVIKPVFEAKCTSCHNPDKRKGKLLLTDSGSVLKGGKTGKLFVAGQPGESLLLQRIHLPLDDKKHMPPSGKPQLTDDERDLLHHWISSGLAFDTPVNSLPETDSFRLAASRIFEARQSSDRSYDFDAVAQSTLDRLNSNYRVIRPVSKSSPALSVNIYNKAVFTPQTLDELKDVEQQVVSLDLSKMPVTNEDLRHVLRLKNLERLNLNFTGITGAGLAGLEALKHLESLSLAGTSINYSDLQKIIPRFEKLKSLAVWQTSLTGEEIKKLQDEFKNVEILGVSVEDDMLIKLNPPRLANKVRVFDDSISLELFHPVRDVNIRFTTDGSDPDSVTSELFKGKTILTETSSIKARAFKDGWMSSDVATLAVYKSSHKPDTAILLTKLNRVHPANGAQTFFDQAQGTFNANSPAWANNWAGFIGHNMELLLRYDRPAKVSSVSLNTLIETETSIFPPATIEIWGGSTRDDLKLIKRTDIEMPTVYRKPYIELVECEFESHEVTWLKIVAKPVMSLPLWHKKPNKPALLLIDEILVN